jgi:hypothetical protein
MPFYMRLPCIFAAVEFTPQAVSPLVVLIIGKTFFNEIASNQILTWSGSLGYIDSVFFEPQYKYIGFMAETKELKGRSGINAVSSTDESCSSD